MSMSCFFSMTLHKSLVGTSLWTSPYLGVLKFCVKSQREQPSLTVSKLYIARLHMHYTIRTPYRVDYMNDFLSVQYYLLLPTHTQVLPLLVASLDNGTKSQSQAGGLSISFFLLLCHTVPVKLFQGLKKELSV